MGHPTMTNPRDDLMALAPCPFCGGEATVVEIEPHSHSGGIAEFMPDHPGSAYIDCVCGVGIIDASKDDAIKRWNTRAASRPATQVVDREAVVALEKTHAHIFECLKQTKTYSSSQYDNIRPFAVDQYSRAVIHRLILEEWNASLEKAISLLRPAEAWDSATSPGMTDLMISPESLDAVGEPVTDKDLARYPSSKARQYASEAQSAMDEDIYNEEKTYTLARYFDHALTNPPVQPDTSAAVLAERERCAAIASYWGVSELNNGDLTDDQLNAFLNEIGPNIAAAIRQLPTTERGE